MKKISIILFFIFFQCAYYNTFFNAKKFFNDAEKERLKNTVDQVVPANAKQNYTKAIEKASRLLEMYPNSKYVDDALFILGQSFYYKEEYRKAQRKFEELFENFPESDLVPISRLWLGKTNTLLRDYETAEKNFYDILKSKADQKIIDEAQLLLGGLYFFKEDYVVALEEYKRAAQNAREKAVRSQAYYQLGESYYKLKDYSSAASSYEKARKYSPDAKAEYESSFKAGQAYKALKEYDKGIRIFTELLGDIANEQNWGKCKLEIAECLSLKGEIEDAISWYESIVNEHKKTDEAAKAYFNLGEIYQKTKFDYNQAKEYFDLATKEYSRTDILEEAKLRSKNVQNLIALRADIVEQEKRIAAGDSVAASMDSLSTDIASPMQTEDRTTETSQNLSQDAFPDSMSHTNFNPPDDPNQFGNMNPDDMNRRSEFDDQDRFQQQDSTLTPQNRRLDREPERQPPNLQENAGVKQTLSLKKGKLGTPQEELIKDKIMLAEIYLFEFNQPDSALFEYLDIIQEDTTAEIVSKAIYSLAYIFENYKKDSLVADSIYQNLLQAYPNSVYAQQIRKKLHLLDTTKEDAPVRELFNRAEREYHDAKNFERALDRYAEVVKNHPESDYAPKSLLAIGWIYDNEMNDNDKALETYQKLIEGYPETPYTKMIKKKIDAYDKYLQEKEKGATADTSLVAMQNVSGDQSNSHVNSAESAESVAGDKEIYLENLRREMDKDNPRLRNPKRIIKNEPGI